MKTYEEIIKEVEKDYENYTLEDKVQAINVYSFEKNNGVNVNSLSKEEYEKYNNEREYDRAMYLKVICAKSDKKAPWTITEEVANGLVLISNEEALTLLERGIKVGYAYGPIYHGTNEGDYFYREVNSEKEFHKEGREANRMMSRWSVSPVCVVKKDILEQYEATEQNLDVSDVEISVLPEAIKTSDGKVTLTLEQARDIYYQMDSFYHKEDIVTKIEYMYSEETAEKILNDNETIEKILEDYETALENDESWAFMARNAIKKYVADSEKELE